MDKKFVPYTIVYKQMLFDGVYIVRMKPERGSIMPFKAGQYVFLKTTEEGGEHPFSIASAPENKSFLEFCVKISGNWTRDFCENKTVGDTCLVSSPFGSFVWKELLQYAVFLCGGIGITPLISILNSIAQSKEHPALTMIYGSRTFDTIAYKSNLDTLSSQMKSLHVIHVLSNIAETDPWKGYRGNISKEILGNEVDFSRKPTFFVIGPVPFIDLMDGYLKDFNVTASHIQKELL